ncbi:MAG: hypothetical protein ACREDR_26930, partial [Blastocatellia bacterium]
RRDSYSRPDRPCLPLPRDSYSRRDRPRLSRLELLDSLRLLLRDSFWCARDLCEACTGPPETSATTTAKTSVVMAETLLALPPLINVIMLKFTTFRGLPG